MSDDRKQLKDLLLSEEIAQIKALQAQLDDQQKLSQKVSEVLERATDLTIEKNPGFVKKFNRQDPNAYVRAIKANKQTFIDALLPIIGPIIRKSVANSIRRFVADVNRAMEMGFSMKALKWRWQAYRSGVSFPEIVFNNTIEYQVQQVFLIDNETGLLIEHAGHEEDLLQDKEAMSAMLTAIQDFVKDSLDRQSDGLSSAEFGDRLIWPTSGNEANLVAVIKGAPTNRLRERLQTACEGLHLEHYHDLKDESRWNNNPELKHSLSTLLLTKKLSEDLDDDPKHINFWPWLIILLLLFGYWGWQNHRATQSRNDLEQQLRNTPGLVVQSISEADDGYRVKALIDPDADLSHVSPNVDWDRQAFVSLEDDMVQKRVNRLLSNSGINASVNNGEVTLEGSAHDPALWLVQKGQLPLIAGVNTLTDNTQMNLNTRLQAFLEKNPVPPGINIQAESGAVIANGLANTESSQTFITQLKSTFKTVNDNNLKLLDFNELKTSVNAPPLLFTNTQALTENNKSQLDELVGELKPWLTMKPTIQLTITAKSDCQGSANTSNNNNEERLQLVSRYLIQKGIPEALIQAHSNPCQTTTDFIDSTQIGVWFEVTE